MERYMPIDADLKPCPFCGGPAVLTNVRMSNHTFIIGCYNELCVRPRTDGYGAKEDVIGLWNYRPTPRPVEQARNNLRLSFHALVEEVANGSDAVIPQRWADINQLVDALIAAAQRVGSGNQPAQEQVATTRRSEAP